MDDDDDDGIGWDWDKGSVLDKKMIAHLALHTQLGSALQLSTFSSIKETIRQSGQISELWVPVLSSLISSLNIVIFMEPLDVVR